MAALPGPASALLLLAIFSLQSTPTSAQSAVGSSCPAKAPACIDQGRSYSFSGSATASDAPPPRHPGLAGIPDSNTMGCLAGLPEGRLGWLYLRSNSGPSTLSFDVAPLSSGMNFDVVVWGPFTTSNVCGAQLGTPILSLCGQGTGPERVSFSSTAAGYFVLAIGYTLQQGTQGTVSLELSPTTGGRQSDCGVTEFAVLGGSVSSVGQIVLPLSGSRVTQPNGEVALLQVTDPNNRPSCSAAAPTSSLRASANSAPAGLEDRATAAASIPIPNPSSLPAAGEYDVCFKPAGSSYSDQPGFVHRGLRLVSIALEQSLNGGVGVSTDTSGLRISTNQALPTSIQVTLVGELVRNVLLSIVGAGESCLVNSGTDGHSIVLMSGSPPKGDVRLEGPGDARLCISAVSVSDDVSRSVTGAWQGSMSVPITVDTPLYLQPRGSTSLAAAPTVAQSSSAPFRLGGSSVTPGKATTIAVVEDGLNGNTDCRIQGPASPVKKDVVLQSGQTDVTLDLTPLQPTQSPQTYRLCLADGRDDFSSTTSSTFQMEDLQLRDNTVLLQSLPTNVEVTSSASQSCQQEAILISSAGGAVCSNDNSLITGSPIGTQVFTGTPGTVPLPSSLAPGDYTLCLRQTGQEFTAESSLGLKIVQLGFALAPSTTVPTSRTFTLTTTLPSQTISLNGDSLLVVPFSQQCPTSAGQGGGVPPSLASAFLFGSGTTYVSNQLDLSGLPAGQYRACVWHTTGTNPSALGSGQVFSIKDLRLDSNIASEGQNTFLLTGAGAGALAGASLQPLTAVTTCDQISQQASVNVVNPINSTTAQVTIELTNPSGSYILCVRNGQQTTFSHGDGFIIQILEDFEVVGSGELLQASRVWVALRGKQVLAGRQVLVSTSCGVFTAFNPIASGVVSGTDGNGGGLVELDLSGNDVRASDYRLCLANTAGEFTQNLQATIIVSNVEATVTRAEGSAGSGCQSAVGVPTDFTIVLTYPGSPRSAALIQQSESCSAAAGQATQLSPVSQGNSRYQLPLQIAPGGAHKLCISALSGQFLQYRDNTFIPIEVQSDLAVTPFVLNAGRTQSISTQLGGAPPGGSGGRLDLHTLASPPPSGSVASVRGCSASPAATAVIAPSGGGALDASSLQGGWYLACFLSGTPAVAKAARYIILSEVVAEPTSAPSTTATQQVVLSTRAPLTSGRKQVALLADPTGDVRCSALQNLNSPRVLDSAQLPVGSVSTYTLSPSRMPTGQYALCVGSTQNASQFQTRHQVGFTVTDGSVANGTNGSSVALAPLSPTVLPIGFSPTRVPASLTFTLTIVGSLLQTIPNADALWVSTAGSGCSNRGASLSEASDLGPTDARMQNQATARMSLSAGRYDVCYLSTGRGSQRVLLRPALEVFSLDPARFEGAAGQGGIRAGEESSLIFQLPEGTETTRGLVSFVPLEKSGDVVDLHEQCLTGAPSVGPFRAAGAIHPVSFPSSGPHVLCQYPSSTTTTTSVAGSGKGRVQEAIVVGTNGSLGYPTQVIDVLPSNCPIAAVPFTPRTPPVPFFSLGPTPDAPGGIGAPIPVGGDDNSECVMGWLWPVLLLPFICCLGMFAFILQQKNEGLESELARTATDADPEYNRTRRMNGLMKQIEILSLQVEQQKQHEGDAPLEPKIVEVHNTEYVPQPMYEVVQTEVGVERVVEVPVPHPIEKPIVRVEKQMVEREADGSDLRLERAYQEIEDLKKGLKEAKDLAETLRRQSVGRSHHQGSFPGGTPPVSPKGRKSSKTPQVLRDPELVSSPLGPVGEGTTLEAPRPPMGRQGSAGGLDGTGTGLKPEAKPKPRSSKVATAQRGYSKLKEGDSSAASGTQPSETRSKRARDRHL